MAGWFGAYGSATRGLGTVDELVQDLNNCIVNSSLERPYQVKCNIVFVDEKVLTKQHLERNHYVERSILHLTPDSKRLVIPRLIKSSQIWS